MHDAGLKSQFLWYCIVTFNIFKQSINRLCFYYWIYHHTFNVNITFNLHQWNINETSKTIIFKGPHRLNWARSWSFSTWHRVSTSPIIIALPLNSINTSIFVRSILPTSYALLFTATKGKVIEFTGFGPMALFLSKSVLSFCCWFSSL